MKWQDDEVKVFDNFDMVVEEEATDHWDAIIEGKNQTKD